MIPRIKSIEPQEGYHLLVQFDDGQTVIYDVNADIEAIEDFVLLKTEPGLFKNFSIDESRTCVSWSDRIDLPSDTLLEYGKPVTSPSTSS